MLKGNSKVTLWYDGLIVEQSRKRERMCTQSPDDADEVSTKTKKK